MDQSTVPTSSSGTLANPSSPPPPSSCGSGSSVGVGIGESMLVPVVLDDHTCESMLIPVVLDDLTFDNRQVRSVY